MEPDTVPAWIKDKELGNGPIVYLKKKEETFFKVLKYFCLSKSRLT